MRILLLALALLNPVQRLDEAVAARLRAVAAAQEARGSAWPGVMRAATSWGRPAVLVGGVVVVIAEAAAGNGWGLARVTVAALAGTNLVVEAGKRAVNRTRPDGERKRSNSSFPSSHAANAFALAYVLGHRWRRACPAFAALATLVAFSRMYLGRHYLSDVVVGALVGVAVAWAAQRWLGVRRKRAPATTAG